MGTVQGVRVHSDSDKAWTVGMAEHDRPDLVLFELRPDWARLRVPRRQALQEVLESAAAAVVALDELRIDDLTIHTPFGSYRFEDALFGLVELRLVDA